MANAGLDSFVCFGETANLGGVITASGGESSDYRYIWYPANILVDNSESNPVSVPLTSTTSFFVQVFDDSTNCSATDITTVFVTDPSSGVVVREHQKISLDSGGLTSNQFDFNDRFGQSVAALGDLNGDGIPDASVGGYRYNNGEGAAWVLFMNVDGTILSFQRITTGEGGFTGNIGNDEWFG